MNKRHYILMLISMLWICNVQGSVKPRGYIYNPWSSCKSLVRKEVNRIPMTVGKRETAPLTSMGTPAVPVVLVQFADKKFSANQDAEHKDTVDLFTFYDRYLNGLRDGGHYYGGGSVGAVAEYFRDQSYGQFVPEFHVIGPITLDKDYAWYGNNDKGRDWNISAFYKEAIQKAQEWMKNEGKSWNTFDNNNDGKVDMAYFIYAGRGENDSQQRDENAIWPAERGNGGTIGGIAYGAYACCNEIFNGKADGIGVMCHELSHALGLPDFYDTNYEAYGLDYLDIMDSGNYCQNGYRPCYYSAYERDFMGWRELITLEADKGQDVTLYPMSSDQGYGYKIVNKENPNEYYVLENRQNQGWDKYFGYGTDTYGRVHGMMVIHIDYKESRWTANSVNTDEEHQLCTIIPADDMALSSMFAGTKEIIDGVDYKYTFINYHKSMSGDMYPGVPYEINDEAPQYNITFEGCDNLMGKRAMVYTKTGSTPGEMKQPITDIVEHSDGTITFKFCGGDPDGIDAVNSTIKQNVIYNINGQRLSNGEVPSAKGLYIINGRKVLIKK